VIEGAPLRSRVDIRARYADTDRMGVVHHARFLEYLEIGRVDLMRRTGLSYRELEGQGIYYPVIEVWVRYRRSVTFDDVLALDTWYRELERTRVTFAYRLRAPDGEVAAEALTLHAQTDSRGRPGPIAPGIAERVRPHLTDEDLPRARLRGR
jgi:acyl-CoA thioester hydrolase